MSLRSAELGWKWIVAENLALKLLSGSSPDNSLGSDDDISQSKTNYHSSWMTLNVDFCWGRKEFHGGLLLDNANIDAVL